MIHGFIVIRKKNGADGPKFPVKKTVKIGRGTQCDVRIHVQSVSEQHCLIFVEKGKKAVIQNLSSTAQTLVNGVSIGKSYIELAQGDIVTVGERSFTWYYGPSTPFHRGSNAALKKRRKSEADSTVTQNIAVVKPLYHKRRTLGAFSDLSSGTRSLTVEAVSDVKRKCPLNTTSKAKTPPTKSPVRSPRARSSRSSVVPSRTKMSMSTPSKQSLSAKTPVQKESLSKTPSKRFSVAKSSVSLTPVLKTSAKKSLSKSSIAHNNSTPKSPLENESLVVETPAKSPAVQTLANSTAVKTPSKSPAVKTLSKSPAVKTPSKSPAVKTAAKSPAVKVPLKSPAVKTPTKSPAVKAPSKSPVVKTPSKSPSAKTPSKSSSIKTSKYTKTPATKSPSTLKKSPSVTISTGKSKRSLKIPRKTPPKSFKRTEAQKRRLSSSPAVLLKRMKMDSSSPGVDESTVIKTPRHAKGSTLSTVKLILSAKKTPVIKAIKTPRSSTVTKQNSKRFTPAHGVKSSVKKTQRPLFSDILKKKAVKIANAVSKKLDLEHKSQIKPASMIVVRRDYATKIPPKFQFSATTGHANSPEPIFIGRKVMKTPTITRKGRKDPLLPFHLSLKDNTDLSGVPEMFKTPGKVVSSPKVLSVPVEIKDVGHARSSARLSRQISEPNYGNDSPSNQNYILKNQASPNLEKTAAMKTQKRFSLQTLSNSSRNSPSPSSSDLVSTYGSNIFKEYNPQSSANKPLSMLTSTPATIKRQSSASSIFDSPYSLTGLKSSPHSPASGRKSRLDMVNQKNSYVHSPIASPVKSSLKSSPTRSPLSGEHSKNMSVSFSDSIHIQMLVPGSKKRLNTTAPLSLPHSPSNDEQSCIGSPDGTTFDFNSIKTPNVPREMFVSSILSSGSSSGGQASGSAKRKGKAQRSSENNLSNLQGVRRLMKSPASPAGYIDVKGVKRLMAPSCKTPTYLAVEGVKKLFGDAVAAAGNELSSFAGVRELFSSPPSLKVKQSGRLSLKTTPELSPGKSSPVAKIQAEVEGKKTPSLLSPLKKRSSILSTSEKRGPIHSTMEAASNVDLGLDMSSEKSLGKRSRLSATDKDFSKASPEAQKKPHDDQPVARRGRRTVRAISPSAVIVDSPKKRTTRKTAKAPSPVKSPEKESRNVRTRRGAKNVSPVRQNELPSRKRNTRAMKDLAENSPEREPLKKGFAKRAQDAEPAMVKSPVKTRRAAAKRANVSKTPSPVAKTVKTQGKRQKIQTAPVESESPKKPSPKASARNKRGSKRETLSEELNKCSDEKKVATRKRKVTFDDDVPTPKKRGKATVAVSDMLSDDQESVDVKKTTGRKGKGIEKSSTGEEKSSKRTKKAPKNPSPVLTISPRRTRSRK